VRGVRPGREGAGSTLGTHASVFSRANNDPI
jgi:hypothetical protein